jgi:hypothetical protein
MSSALIDAAEAGEQSAVNWLVYNYTNPSDYSSFDLTKSPVVYNGMPVILSAMTGHTANYPDNTVQTSFSSALLGKTVPGSDVALTYSVTATLQSMRLITPIGSSSQKPLQTWLILSQGSVGSSAAQVQVTTTIERLGNAAFSYAAFGSSNACGAVSFAGGSITDSYDSISGNYATTHQDSNGDIGSNGNIVVDGVSTTINGNAASPYSGDPGDCAAASSTGLTLKNGAAIGFNVTMLTMPSSVSVPTPDPPVPTPPTIAQTTTGTCGTISGCTVLSGVRNLSFAPGNYGNLSIAGATTVHISAGTYNLNSLSVSAGSRLVVDSGPVIINIAGAGVAGNALSFTGGATISNTSGHPSDLQIVYAGSQPVTLTGGANTYGVVYAPNAPLNFSSGSDWYGSLIANTVKNTSGTSIHYDRSLAANLLSIGDYHVTSFSWSKY